MGARFNKYPVRYQGMDMGMKGDQITEGLHKQDISGFAPGRDLFVDLVQQSGDNPTPPAVFYPQLTTWCLRKGAPLPLLLTVT